MPRNTAAVELNNFVGGLITEASPLTFPVNASMDEQNFVLNRDGSRERRLGMDYENAFQIRATAVTTPVNDNLAVTSFRWKNVGGDAGKTLIVVQVGNLIDFYDASFPTLSAGRVFGYLYDDSVKSTKFSYAVVDGLLVVATGSKLIDVYDFSTGTMIITHKTLYVRDMFGVQDIDTDGTNLREGSGVSRRPSALSFAHTYNLRNQTWAIPRLEFFDQDDGHSTDTIGQFAALPGAKFPSNADSVNFGLYSNPAIERGNKDVIRFNERDVVNNPPGNVPAPAGYFIIDALSRGQSRMSEISKLMTQYPSNTYGVGGLPQDLTPGGPTCIAEFSSRVFYAGFSGSVSGGDDHSPRLSSYILFSQLVEDLSDINACYQEADPTNKDDSDLVDTDGGFIRVEGAYDINCLVSIGNGLAVLASNGVWLIQGGSDYGFKATNYKTTKISARGCISPGSVVVVDNSFLYWSDDGIYNCAPNQFGDYVADNLTQKTIQHYYDAIDPQDAKGAEGVYDSYEKKVKWLWGNRTASSIQTHELVLDTTLGAFYPHVIGQIGGNKYPMAVKGVVTEPFKTVPVTENVVTDGVNVTASGVIVTVSATNATVSTPREVRYLTLTKINPVSYTFSYYRDQDHYDWFSVNQKGVDAVSFLLTGTLAAGDYQRTKTVPSVTFHFRKTEDGFIDDLNGDWTPTNQSSCLVQAQWNWSNNINSGQWSRQFEAYRFRRQYRPKTVTENFDNGYYVVETKNKLRGSGKVLSLYICSSPGKHMNLLGWSMAIGVNNNV